MSVSRAERRVALVRRQALLLDGARQVALDRRAAALPELGRHLAPDGLVARGHADLRDPGAHRAQSDDSDLHAGDPTEESAAPARPVDMKLALLVFVLLLAVLGAFVELVRGRRPVLVARPA